MTQMGRALVMVVVVVVVVEVVIGTVTVTGGGCVHCCFVVEGESEGESGMVC